MNTTDIVLLIPVLFGFVRGIWTGLIQEVAGIVGIIAGIILGYTFNEPTVYFLNDQLEISIETANIAAFVLLFVGGYVTVLILAKMLTKGVSMMALGPVNRVLGGLFSAIKYTVLTLVLLSAFDRINHSANIVAKEKLEASVVYRTYSELSQLLWEYVPEDNGLNFDAIQGRFESIQDSLNTR
ncbi:CvpA family protein [Phaeocystidibacter marisrubri]|uniref:CvpA family protein n=1 Tax=Phaeocystidibacter marisrubri TaxID=1577780 RepID=A0A6L3ZHM4_9FLAO|nr:CvpA family protein [Phaeocystidibacter marisrubri]KAB2816509.1 CvpA family protein [Phaeocystidibacter marisrubri]GGH69415.1 hypothetical protein GCM10011318_10410 [Phaeocystidibacter marisrubri]